MDAAGLIQATRRALARSTEGRDIIAEAWQAQALAAAVGERLVVNGPLEVRAQATRLCEVSGRARGSLREAARRADEARAEQLTGIRDPLTALHDLGWLLGESGAALVTVAVGAEEEGLYWRCIEGIDAADECGDRLTEIRQRLAPRYRHDDGDEGDTGGGAEGGDGARGGRPVGRG